MLGMLIKLVSSRKRARYVSMHAHLQRDASMNAAIPAAQMGPQSSRYRRWASRFCWRAFSGFCIEVMRAAAAKDAAERPAWWLGEIVQHDLRGPDIAVITIRPDPPLP